MSEHFKVGDKVFWMATQGGGGGSGKRQNVKRPYLAVVTKVFPARLRIRVIMDWNGRWKYSPHETLVKSVNVRLLTANEVAELIAWELGH